MDARIYKNKKMIIFFLIPAFVMMFIFLYYPFVQNIINCFKEFDQNYVSAVSGKFTWQDPWYSNFKALMSDTDMICAIKNTGIVIIATIFGQVGIALLLALLVSNIKKLAGLYRVVYFFPIVVAATALGLMFNLILLYQSPTKGGLLNEILLDLNIIDKAIDFKGQFSMASMLIPVIWQYVGFYFVILLTGLSGIPEDLYEAASIDGASKIQRVRYITLPLLRNSIGTCVILAVTGALKVFDLPQTMFKNPASLNVWLTGTYMYSFSQSDIDYAASISVIIVVLGVVLSFIVNKLFESNENYDA